MPVRASFNPQALLGVGRCLRLCGLASNALAVGNRVVERSTFCVRATVPASTNSISTFDLGSGRDTR